MQLYDGPGLEGVVGAHVVALPRVELHTVVLHPPPDSAVPSLTFEAVSNGDSLWLSVDLLPRVDLTDHPAYRELVYEPLTDTQWQLHGTAGVQQARILARLRMVCSPWLLTVALDPVADDAARAATRTYLDHWCDLLDGALPAAVCPPESVTAERVRRERALHYSHDATHNYARLDAMVGRDAVAQLQAWLRDPSDVAQSGARP